MREQFTAGPWFINDTYSTLFQIDSGSGSVCVVDCSYLDTQYNMEIKPTAEESANANLIATAPEMYAMLESIMDDENDGGSLYRANLIKDLLTKARGEK